MFRTILAAAFLAATLAAAEAAPQSYALDIRAGQLSGPGAKILTDEIAHAQFILYGEDHGFADSPIVLRAIAKAARPQGFERLVIETGPLTTRLFADTLARDGLAGVHRLIHRVPLGIPFLSLRQDAMLAGDFHGHDAKGAPFLCGVDQEFIGSSVFHLERLVALAPNARARTKTGKLLAEERAAAAKADQQHFLLMRFGDADFDSLASAFAGRSDAETIIAEMKESAAIYQLWIRGHNYENNARRARLLARNFLNCYHAAADAMPKFLFKMGLEHVALGTTTSNTVDLGTLATSIARLNDKGALRIAFLPTGGRTARFAPKAGNPYDTAVYDDPDVLDVFAAIGLDTTTLPRTGWTLIPLAPIRQSLDTKGINKLKPIARLVVLGYDYVITTPDAKAGAPLY